jgi:sulfate permease, SulP family
MLDFFRRQSAGLKDEVLAGVTVSLALVPEAVAFALIAGVSPLTGLYAAVVVGLVTSLFGGRPGMISGATGAMAVVMVSLIKEHGVEYLFPAVVLAGLIQVTVGLLRWGKYIRLVPHSVMLGFVNGLAIVIFMAQIPGFKTTTQTDEGPVTAWMAGPMLYAMVGLVVFTMLIIHFLTKLTRAVPSSLVAILTTTLIAALVMPGLGIQLPTVGTLAGSISGGLPPFNFPVDPMTWGSMLTLETLGIIAPYAFILAGVGLIESLMTLTLIDEITDTRGRGNKECMAQGAANILSGMFSGMGGCAMIGQSLINVNSGGRRRISGVVAAVCLMMFVLFLAPWIEKLSMAALIGLMFMVSIGTFEWLSMRTFRKIPRSDVMVMLVVTLVTVLLHNLALAVLVGVIFSALVFAWQHAANIGADSKPMDDGAKLYQLHGPLFFGSVSRFRDLFDPVGDPERVVVDFYYTRVYDQSGLEAINSLAERYAKLGKQLTLRHLSPECRQLLDRAGRFVEVNISEDPHYHVSTDRLA